MSQNKYVPPSQRKRTDPTPLAPTNVEPPKGGGRFDSLGERAGLFGSRKSDSAWGERKQEESDMVRSFKDRTGGHGVGGKSSLRVMMEASQKKKDTQRKKKEWEEDIELGRKEMERDIASGKVKAPKNFGGVLKAEKIRKGIASGEIAPEYGDEDFREYVLRIDGMLRDHHEELEQNAFVIWVEDNAEDLGMLWDKYSDDIQNILGDEPLIEDDFAYAVYLAAKGKVYTKIPHLERMCIRDESLVTWGQYKDCTDIEDEEIEYENIVGIAMDLGIHASEYSRDEMLSFSGSTTLSSNIAGISTPSDVIIGMDIVGAVLERRRRDEKINGKGEE